jgi:hypothetical protein
MLSLLSFSLLWNTLDADVLKMFALEGWTPSGSQTILYLLFLFCKSYAIERKSVRQSYISCFFFYKSHAIAKKRVLGLTVLYFLFLIYKSHVFSKKYNLSQALLKNKNSIKCLFKNLTRFLELTPVLMSYCK